MQNGGYSVRKNIIYVYGNIDGKRYRISTGKEATKANLKWIEKNYRDALLKLIVKEKPAEKIYLKGFGLQVIEMSSHKRDEATQNDYLYKFKTFVLPYFGSYQLNQIKVMDLEQWQSTLLNQMSTSSVKTVRSVLNMILSKAVANEYINRNPIDYIDNITVVTEKKVPYTIDEVTKLLTHATGWFRIYLLVAFTSGMRVGELLGLRWEDIDLERGIIDLNRSITGGKTKQSSENKNHDRFVILPAFVKTALQEFKHDHEWVFISKHRKPFCGSKSVINYHFKPLLEKLSIEYKTLSATRHTFISIMRNGGIDKNFIQDLVGHKQGSSVTDKYYATLDVTNEKIEIINNIFDKKFGHKLGTLEN